MANTGGKTKFLKTRRDNPDRFTASKYDENTQGTDFLDGAPEDLPYSIVDFGVTFFSIITYLIDVGSDVWLCYMYFRDGDMRYFACSVAFIVIPSVTMSLFSLWWYIADYKQEIKATGKSKVGCGKWFVRAFMLAFQLAPVLRYIESLIYGVKSKLAKNYKSKYYYYNLMLYEDADSTLLRLIESFMESAPQLVLQLFIMATQTEHNELPRVIFQAVSCSLSLLSLAWSLTSYHKALRFTRDDKNNMTYSGMGIHFLWQAFIIGPRVVAISMFSSYYTYYIFPFLGAHWVFMSLWLVKQKTNFCNHKFEEIFFNAVCGIIYIFCFFNVKEGNTRHKYAIYYTLTYAENLGLIIPWYVFMDNNRGSWYHHASLGFVLIGHFVGIFFMWIYYKCFHPALYLAPTRPTYASTGCYPDKVPLPDIADITLPDNLSFDDNVICSTPTKLSVKSSFETSSKESSNSQQRALMTNGRADYGTPV